MSQLDGSGQHCRKPAASKLEQDHWNCFAAAPAVGHRLGQMDVQLLRCGYWHWH
jgi:hypothetical protein